MDLMVKNEAPCNKLLASGQPRRNHKRKSVFVEDESFTEAVWRLKDDLANHFFTASNKFGELAAAKEKITSLENTVDNLKKKAVSGLTVSEVEKLHALENTIEELNRLSAISADVGFPGASGGFEEMRKNLEPLLSCIKDKRQMNLEMKKLRIKLESCEDQNRVNQQKLNGENQELMLLKSKLNIMELHNKNLLVKEKMSTLKLDKAQKEMLSMKTKLDKMEECNQYLMLKDQRNTHKLDETNNELLMLKTQLHEMEENSGVLNKQLEEKADDMESLNQAYVVKEQKFSNELQEAHKELLSLNTKLHEMEENLDVMNKQLEEKTNDMEHMESLNQVYVVLERERNTELHEARKELISGLQKFLSDRTMIGIKRMGELKQKPFRDVCMQKFSNAEQDLKSAEQCSHWQERIKDPQWFPFTVIEINGKYEEIINENDEELKKLKNEWGDQVYEAIFAALKEVNEYNPSGRYPVPELWNVKEDRKAHLREVIQYLLKLAKKPTRR